MSSSNVEFPAKSFLKIGGGVKANPGRDQIKILSRNFFKIGRFDGSYTFFVCRRILCLLADCNCDLKDSVVKNGDGDDYSGGSSDPWKGLGLGLGGMLLKVAFKKA